MMIGTGLVVGVAFLVVAQADEPPPRPITSPLRYVPDPSYRPAPGDYAVLFEANPSVERPGAVLACRDWLSFDAYLRSQAAEDYVGIVKMLAAGDVVEARAGTRVKVIEVVATTAVVRVFEGRDVGKKLWARTSCVVRLVPNPDYSPIDGETAATLLAEAVRLEKAGDLAGADRAYRDVELFFPDTAEGLSAAGWIKLAEKKAAEKLQADAPARLLKIARDLERGGKTVGAAGRYRELIKLHPASPEATEAKARLAALGAAAGSK